MLTFWRLHTWTGLLFPGVLLYKKDGWAWLEIVFTPIKEVLKTTHFSCPIFFQLNNLNRYHKSWGCGHFETEHSKRYKNHFLTANRYNKHPWASTKCLLQACNSWNEGTIPSRDRWTWHLFIMYRKQKRKRQRSSLSRMLPTLDIKLQCKV